jgi:hypothetical protein
LLFGHCYLAFVLALHAFVLLCGHLIWFGHMYIACLLSHDWFYIKALSISS